MRLNSDPWTCRIFPQPPGVFGVCAVCVCVCVRVRVCVCVFSQSDLGPVGPDVRQQNHVDIFILFEELEGAGLPARVEPMNQ